MLGAVTAALVILFLCSNGGTVFFSCKSLLIHQIGE